MRRVVLLILLLFAIFNPDQSCAGASTLTGTDSVSIPIYFRVDDALVLFDYRSNEQSLKRVGKLLSADSVDKIAHITISGSSSIEGQADYNNTLAQKRAASLYGHLLWRYPALKQISVSMDVVHNDQALIDLVAESPTIPNYQQVVDILKSSATNTSKVKSIKSLPNGTYSYISAKILPLSRLATSCVVYFKIAPSQQITPLEDIQADTLAVVAQSPTIPEQAAVTEPLPQQTTQEREIPATKIIESEFIKKPFVAIKTNLLFDAVSALNVEVEIPIGKRWSIAGEWIFPWWLWGNKQHCLQLLSGNIEGRYWLNNPTTRKVMTGWFVGLYAGGGYYDLEWDRSGYQGEFFIAMGASVGYEHSIAKSLRMEYSLGVGYMNTTYREYDAKMDKNSEWHLIRRNNGNFSWFGPTRAKVSLVWFPQFKVKKRGGAR